MNNEWKIVLLALTCFVLGTSEYVIVGVLDKIALSSDITIAQAGQLITVFAITVSLGTPIAIYFTSKMDQRKVMIMALSLVVVSCLMMVASNTYALFLVSRIVMASGVGVFNVLCFLVATKLAKPERRGRAVSTVTLGFNAALIIGLPIGRIVTGLFGWQANFIITAALVFISIFVIIRFIPAYEGEAPAPFRSELKLLKKHTIILSLLTSFFWIMGYSLLYTYITPYLQHRASINDHLLSTTFLVFGIATLVGNRTGGVLGDRIGVNRTILISLVCNVSLLILFSIFSRFVYPAIAILMLWGMFAWMPGPLFRYNAIALAPGSQGVILSLYNSILQLGMAIGAGTGGVEIEHMPTVTLSWTSASIIFVSLVFAVVSNRASASILKVRTAGI
ncbi:MAG TPA: MFS transporter [Ferruginibacter sp.]|nr:MFS transporter [Ferruginibacter sp.]